jgi:hypothetical protein
MSNYGRVQGSDDAGDALPEAPVVILEQLGFWSGTCEIFNNIIVDPHPTTRDKAIGLGTSGADQITYLDYNAGYYAAGPAPTPVWYTDRVVVSAGKGMHDFVVNPRFVDPSRKFSTFDASLGGPGTVSNCIAEFLKMNGYSGSTYDPRYNNSDLLAYMREGFTPRSRDRRLLRGGRYGDFIGAVQPRALPKTRVNPFV